MPSVMAIHFGEDGERASACAIYRTTTVYERLAEAGWVTSWMPYADAKRMYLRDGFYGAMERLSAFDLIVLPRAAAVDSIMLRMTSAFVAILRLMGKHVVYEVDDDYTNEHRDFSSYGVNHAMEIAGWCDAITVTTPYLADLMKRKTKRPVYVLPNCVEPTVWNRPEYRLPQPKISIGLSGSPTHEQDWIILKDVLPRLVEQYGDRIELRITGYHPAYLQGMPNTRYLPPTTYGQYIEVVRSCDIVLAPLAIEDKFNLSKSPIKVIEGMAATRLEHDVPVGAVCVATKHPVYRLAIEHDKNGLLVSQTPESWYNTLERLILDADLRFRLQRAGHAWVWKHHDMSRQWRQWDQAYRAILRKPLHLPPQIKDQISNGQLHSRSGEHLELRSPSC